jgi:hypothetical protein
MTVRDYLNQHIRRSMILYLLLVPLGLLGFFVSPTTVFYQLMSIVAVILITAGWYQMFSARCPRCKMRLLLLGFAFRFSIPSWFNSCPSCGLSFDTARE